MQEKIEKKHTKCETLHDKCEILDRIKLYYNLKGNADLARLLCVAPNTITNWYSRNTFDIDKILTNCVGLNFHWLLTGNGDMLISEDVVKSEKVVALTTETNKRLDMQSIPLYGIEATASILSTFADGAIIPEGHLQIPNLTKVDGAVYVTGDSMYPILKSGDIVVFQQINNMEYIVYGNVYLVSFSVDGDDYIVLKYIQKSEDDSCVKLVSHNQHHNDFEIPRSSIRALALVKASIRYNSL